MDPSTSHAVSNKEAESNNSVSAAPTAAREATKVSTSSAQQEHVTSKRKSAVSEQSTSTANEAKRSKLMAESSSLQALLPTISKSSEDVPSPQHQQSVTSQPVGQTGKEDGTTVAAQKTDQEESSTTQKVKDAYEQYISKLEAAGGSIEKEMTKQTDLLYVVTSISRREGDPFGPCLHGIYTTCQKAQEAARKTFEKVSESYRNGNFVPHEKRVATCDMTNYLIPGVAGSLRPLFEVFRPEDDSPEDCTGVAINAVYIEDDVEQSLPYIQDTSSDWIKSALEAVPVAENSNANPIEKNLKVQALFSYKACGSGDEKDVALVGIYKDKDDTMERARYCVQDFITEEVVDDDLVQENLDITNGEIVVVHDAISVSVETVLLDDEDSDKYGEEIEFSIL